ncbi:response regulator transcription factor [Leucobacter sp. cx-328]|uniref:response regulator n=1 Tax=unclassified Leucobacter TaxID=2621730 RepID=UPI00165E2AF3|nr:MULTISPECIES: response regulator transcription factor [unclassified Leucobacter]MBC9944806.1 response regulator transcription factor [Leucobacter sp. cx-328]
MSDQLPASSVTAAIAIAVAIIDDEALVRQGLTLILEAAPGLTVVGSGDGTEALALVRERCPQVVLLDIRMPQVDGLTVLRELTALPDPPHIVMLTTFDMDDYVRTALDLGAAGYLLKDTDPELLPQYVRTAASGGVVLAPLPAQRMREAVRAGGTDHDAVARIAQLTEREREVLVRVAQGDSNTEISRALLLSVGTVKDHVSAILAKLSVSGRVPAALLAERAGLLRTEVTR